MDFANLDIITFSSRIYLIIYNEDAVLASAADAIIFFAFKIYDRHRRFYSLISLDY